MTSFRDIPLVTRKPSTSSLPAALVSEPRLTPSSSIDQLSLHSSTYSLADAIEQAHSHTPVSTGLSGDNSVVEGNMDSSTLEPGCSLDYDSEDEHGDTGTLKYGIRASNSQSSMSSVQSGQTGSRGRLHNGVHSRCSLESSSPQASSSGEPVAPSDGGVPLSAGGPHRERVSSMPEKRCTSLSPPQRPFSTPQPPHGEIQQQFHPPHPVNALWEVQLHLQQQQQQVAVVMANQQQQQLGLGYGGSVVPGWSAQQGVIRPSPPVLTNSFVPPQHVVHPPYPHGNGMMRIPLVDPIHLSMTCPVLTPQNPMSTSVNHTSPRHMVTCCNCAGQGHTVTACPFNTSHSHKGVCLILCSVIFHSNLFHKI